MRRALSRHVKLEAAWGGAMMGRSLRYDLCVISTHNKHKGKCNTLVLKETETCVALRSQVTFHMLLHHWPRVASP